MSRSAPPLEPRNAPLPVALAATLCLCAAMGADPAATLRPASAESRALASLVTRIAEAARQAHPNVVAAGRLTSARRTVAPRTFPPVAAHRPHAIHLLEALHNLPPPAHG